MTNGADSDPIARLMQDGQHRDAIAACAEAYGVVIGRLCMALLGSRADADEATQETLLRAHRAIESVCLDREVAHLKDELMPRYASLVYTGYWWSPERHMLQAAIDQSQQYVNGTVRLKLYKGSVQVVGRKSDDSLFDPHIATFEDDRGAYNQKDAEGFIRLNALRMRIAASRGRRLD